MSRRDVAAVLVLLLTAAGVLSAAGTASAHTALVSSAPSAGQVLQEAPQELVLVFTEDVVELGCELVVTGPDGAAVAVTGSSVEGPTVTWTLEPTVPPGPTGRYTALWRVIAGDGHPVEGELAYEVAPAAAPPEPEATTEPEPPSAPDPTPESSAVVDGEPVAAEPVAVSTAEGTGSTLAWLVAGLGAAAAAAVIVARRRRP